jgi:hypothetical protein
VVQEERQSWVEAVPGGAPFVIQSISDSACHSVPTRRRRSTPPTQEAFQVQACGAGTRTRPSGIRLDRAMSYAASAFQRPFSTRTCNRWAIGSVWAMSFSGPSE